MKGNVLYFGVFNVLYFGVLNVFNRESHLLILH